MHDEEENMSTLENPSEVYYRAYRDYWRKVNESDVGLHRYNILKGTNFQPYSLVKFNMLPNCVSSFYITLLAHDSALDPLEKTFQVRVDEQNANCLDFTCSIARLKDEGAKCGRGKMRKLEFE
ncbi:hypothetical protein DY000_02023540 [Brassica cretica]|uniref:Uncharacterized protein n=1 Tax=Brassica cretica TaxID=69181 RepID=A0ABQ7ELZ5_BRACR|nr:hypothetical protein DY000_02023540 [Brassica cretica]